MRKPDCSFRRCRALASFGSDHGGLLPLPQLLLIDAPEGCERLPDDLVHVVIAVGRKPPDEGYAAGRVRERLVLLEQLLVLGTRDRIIWVALGRRIFIGDGGHRRLLPSQMLVLADAGE